MPRFPVSFLLSASLVVSMAQVAASAALTPDRTPRQPAPVETNLSQATNGNPGGKQLAASHFLSPTSSTPVKSHLLTLHDREVLRQQIQGMAHHAQAASDVSLHTSQP
ncbi:transglutaminase [Thiomonas bhubaneswarensis]|uniref:Uncharacterized protein n=1 Tax=Thiomonas bhubaneswarensis TaxID=339866 RepID=A0A0K6I6S6_9BURK|nr:transglutaminase [Thiomonas bhubaneswarensis]CUA98753.1 hypothetical protein Ga0061069_10816 [Thiomonas bhubaneswarensis]